MISNSIFDESFNIENCKDYILSIQCSLNGFSFIISDPQKSKIIAFKENEINAATPFHFSREIASCLSTEKVLFSQYKAVNVAYLDSNEMLYPNSIVDVSDLPDIFKVMFGEKKESVILFNEVQKGETSVLFSIPLSIHDFFKERYENISFYSYGLPVLNYFLSGYANSMTLALYRYRKVLYTIATDGNKISFFNSFFVKTDSDCLYYTLYVAKEIDLDKRSDLILIGDFEAHSEFVKSLKGFYEKTRFGSIRKTFDSRILTSKPGHYYIPLTELCAL